MFGLIPAGSYLACMGCAILFEDEELGELAARGLMRPEATKYHDRQLEYRHALVAVYTKISKDREPL